MHNLSAVLSSPSPTDLSLYHHVDFPPLMYSTHVRSNSRDVLLHFVLVIGRVHR